jgi:hypothetical protein
MVTLLTRVAAKNETLVRTPKSKKSIRACGARQKITEDTRTKRHKVIKTLYEENKRASRTP